MSAPPAPTLRPFRGRSGHLLLIVACLACPAGAAALERSGSYCNATVDSLDDAARAIEAAVHTSPADFHLCFTGGRVAASASAPLVLDGRKHNHPLGGRIVWRPAAVTNDGSGGAGDRPVITGGAPLTNWYPCNADGRCPGEEWQGVWVHYTKDIPNISAAFLPVRNLWVDGNRAARVSVPGASLQWNATDTGYVSVGDDHSPNPAWATNQVELRWDRVVRNWIAPRCVVSAVQGNAITVAPACWQSLIARNNNQLPPAPTVVENIVAAPGPGEFAATPDYIFYRPLQSSDYGPPANAVVPTSSQLVTGTRLAKHTISGLTFATATTWRAPSLPGGYVPTQTLVSGHGEPTGAVQFDNCTDLVITGNTFAHLGAAYALSVGSASQGVLVNGNTFEDLSGGAVKLGNVLDTGRALSTNPRDADANFTFSGNTIQHTSLEFMGGAAVFAGYVKSTHVAQNKVRYTGYTGISLGWGWGTHVKGPQTFAADNHITGNRLEYIMQALNDGGCTYTLGPQKGSTVSNNFCRTDAAPVVGCFYHDNGSRYFTTTNNVCSTSPAPCVYLQGCCNAPAYDIAVSNLWCRDTAPVRNGCVAENCTIDSKTLYVLKAGTPWPAAAQQIVDGSGVPQ